MEGTIAEVRLFAGNFAPRNWSYCWGQLLSISTNQALFSLIGTIYGGDGRVSFALPDLRGRTAIGQGQGPGLSNYILGEKAGLPGCALTSLTMPSHTHTVTGNLTATAIPKCSTGADSDEPEGTFLGTPASGEAPYNTVGMAKMGIVPSSFSGNVTCANQGASTQHENMMPVLASNYIICMEGVYPSRN